MAAASPRSRCGNSSRSASAASGSKAPPRPSLHDRLTEPPRPRAPPAQPRDAAHTDGVAGMDEHGPVAGMLAPGAQARDELRNLGIVRTCMSEPAVRVLRRSLCPVVGDQALEALEARQPAPSAVD